MRNFFLLFWSFVGVLIIFVVPFSYIIASGVAIKGPNYCRNYFAESNEFLFENSVLTKSIYTRTITSSSNNKHFISGWVIQPKDITKKEKTIVCHFHKNSYVRNKIEIFDGNLLNKVKEVSSSNFNPSVQIGWLVFELGG